MNASIHLTHLFASSAFSIDLTAGFENYKNIKQIFEKNA